LIGYPVKIEYSYNWQHQNSENGFIKNIFSLIRVFTHSGSVADNQHLALLQTALPRCYVLANITQSLPVISKLKIPVDRRNSKLFQY